MGCLASKGIAATSLRDAAAQAHVIPARPHYYFGDKYFGDKAQLQQAVIEEKVMPVFATLREPLLRAGDDMAALVAGFV